MAPPQKSGKIFFGQFSCKIQHFDNFSYIPRIFDGLISNW